LGISKLPLGSLETKCHLDACPMASHRVYYKGKVMTSSSLGCGESCESCESKLPWFILTSKVFQYALTNLLFGLCKSV
jgi:hypothetical protein